MSLSLHPRTGRTRTRGVAALLAGVLLIAGALQVSVAAAQDDTEAAPTAPPELLLIDTVGDPYVIVRSGSEPTEVGVTVGGSEATTETPIALADSGLPIQTALVIDNSAAAETHLQSFLDAATAYINGAGENEQIQVWTTGGAPRLRVGLNNDHDRTATIVDGVVSAAGASLLYDSVRSAARELDGTGPGTTNVIVFAGSIDGGPVEAASASEARGAVQAADAAAFAVAADENIQAAMQSLVSSTFGGAFAATEDPAEIAGYGASLSQAINNTWVIPFASEEIGSNNQISLSIDGTTIRATYASGSTSAGRALAPFAELGDNGIPGFGFLSGDTGRLLGLLLGAIAAGLGAYAVVLLLQKDESALTSVLQAYNDPTSNAADADEESSMSKNAILKRAVEITEDLAERRGFLTRLEGTLERADLPLRGGEALTAAAAVTVGFALVGLLVLGSLPGMLVFAVMGGLLPGFAIRIKASRRQKAFMSQLPDTLNLLSSTLKAGYSFMQGVEAVSQEIEDPMGSELRRIVTEAQLGRPLEDAMDASAERMDSPDFAWAVMAVKIQREVGGNLSELLLTVSETMTERERLRRDVATLTAEGKMSAIVLGLLPILLGMAMWAINPEYINTLFTDSLGKVLLGASIFAALAGFAWMKKIINIEI